MSDLISRQGVIESIDKFIPADPMMSDYTQGISVGLAIATMCIERFSQENDDSSQGLVKDLISRQAAVDICANAIDLWHGQLGEGALVAVRDKISELPSAEPDVIRCKDCKHFEYDHIENVNGIPLIVAHEICMRWCEGTKTSENGYCFLAERKDNG